MLRLRRSLAARGSLATMTVSSRYEAAYKSLQYQRPSEPADAEVLRASQCFVQRLQVWIAVAKPD